MELIHSWLAAGTANALTSSLLHPLDRTRVLIQCTPQTSLFQSLRAQYASGGVRTLWLPGLSASIMREYLYSGPRVGLYVPVRDYLGETLHFEKTSFTLKIFTGVLTGALSCVFSNPIDVIKVRQMLEPKAYGSLIRAVPEIVASEGWFGLYKGVLPSTLRGAAITVGQLSAYDISKGELRKVLGISEGFHLHVAASLIAGVCAAVLAAPADLIKSRAMASKSTSMSTASILRDILREGGPASLFRGVLPAYLRQGPHVLICLPLMEQLRALLGLSYV